MSAGALLRRTLLGAMLALAAAAGCASAAVTDPQPDDMVLGSPHAKVTVIEYASVGCPHCAAWNNTVFPAFKAKYINTGRVRFVVREMTTGNGTIATAGFMLARCAGPSRYFQVVDDIYHRLDSMYQPGAKPGAMLEDIAKSVGMSDAAFKDCLYNQAGLNQLNARVQRHLDQDKVDSTPTFFVGDQRLEGDQSLADLAAAIRAARRKR